MVLQNQEDGYESKFIQKIVRVIGAKLHNPVVALPPNLIGLDWRAETLNHWIRDGSSNAGIAAICGMGGIGKTTLAKFVYEMNKGYFESHCFLEDVRDTSKTSNGLIHLQKKLLYDVLKVEDERIKSVDEGSLKIQDALCSKRILLVLDDVDHVDQINAIFGIRNWFHPGSKVIITTRYESLLMARESWNLHESHGSQFCKIYNVKLMDHDESSRLFCLYAFGQDNAIEDYRMETRRIVNYCGGLPLALIVLGRSLRGKSSVELWRSMADKLQEIPNNQIMEKLKISYESLEDDHDKNLFLHIVCFFIGRDKDKAIQRLDACQFYTVIGMENLIDRCLLSVDHQNKLRMHQLLGDMGREMIRLESPKVPGNHSLIWRHRDSLEVLRERSGTKLNEGFILDMHESEQNDSRREHSPLELEEDSNSIRHTHGSSSENSGENEVEFEVDAFAPMQCLKILHLKHVKLTGSYENFPKSLRWLSWKGFPHESIPDLLSLEAMVVLEMHYSDLKVLSRQSKLLRSLKILDLCRSSFLIDIPDFSLLPILERLVLKHCTSLLEINESIGCLRRLILLNLKECSNLEKLPNNLIRLKSLETLDISGWVNIKQMPDLRRLKSLKILLADGFHTCRFLSPSNTVNASDSQEEASRNLSGMLKLSQGPRISWASCLPSTLVSLSLSYCSLNHDDFPMDLNHLSSLRILNLSGNPFNNLPGFIKHLSIDNLNLASCTNLEILEELHRPKYVDIAYCTSLKKVAFKKTETTTYKTLRHNAGCPSLVELEGDFKIEPLESVGSELIEALEMNYLEIPENMQMMMASRYWGTCSISPVQGLCQNGTFSVFMPGEEVSGWFDHICYGSTLSLRMTAIPPNLGVGGLNICAVYSFTYSEDDCSPSGKSQWREKALNKEYGYQAVKLEVVIHRRNRLMKWSIAPSCFGVPKSNEHIIWFCHLNFMQPRQLVEGDKLSVSVLGRGDYHVIECGVRFLYDCQDSSNSLISDIEEQAHLRGDYSYSSNCWLRPGVSFHPCDLSDSEEITDDDKDSITIDDVAENHEDDNRITGAHGRGNSCSHLP